MSELPTDVAQQALDAAGIDYLLGDLEDGTRPAQVLLRAYGQCLRQLLRAAPWAFARKEASLQLLADASGSTPNVGTVVPSGFIYEYSYPVDAARIRYIPWAPFQNPGVPSNNIQPASPSAPVVSNLGQAPYTGQPIVPARFLLTNDPNYPAPPGSQFWESQGISPQGSTVILTNVQFARCVYTFTAIYPNTWDHLFRAAFVSYLASEIAIPLAKDKKFGLQMKMQAVAAVKEKVTEARIADGNEMWSSSDIRVDWMDFRNAGGQLGWPGYGWNSPGGGYGCFGSGWSGSLSLGGSAY